MGCDPAAINQGIDNMKTSYTGVSDIQISIDLSVGEIVGLIDILEKRVAADPNAWSETELLESLQAVKQTSLAQIGVSIKAYQTE
jgi:hypothetical protein